MIFRSILAVALLSAAALAPAQPRPPDGPVAMPPVEVSAMRDPVEKSYRRIVSGMDLFEQRRGLAPGAELRFKLLPRRRDTRMEEIDIKIVGNTMAIPVDVAADNTFAMPRSQRALDEDAIVVPNRRARTMTWRTDIRTPGLPPGTRRLGDLRLECLVGMQAGLVSEARPLFGLFSTGVGDRGYCEQRVPSYLFFADKPLWSVTLVHGDRREVLPVAQMYAAISRAPMTAAELRHCDCEVLLDRTYYAPLGDRSWPDDTLLHFEYMIDGLRADVQ